MLAGYFVSGTCDFSIWFDFRFRALARNAYLLNKFFTFKQPVHSTAELIRFFSLYGTTLVANVFVNYLALTLLPDFVGDFLSWSYIVILAFVMATGVSTILNFTGQKLWVFKGHKNH